MGKLLPAQIKHHPENKNEQHYSEIRKLGRPTQNIGLSAAGVWAGAKHPGLSTALLKSKSSATCTSKKHFKKKIIVKCIINQSNVYYTACNPNFRSVCAWGVFGICGMCKVTEGVWTYGMC